MGIYTTVQEVGSSSVKAEGAEEQVAKHVEEQAPAGHDEAARPTVEIDCETLGDVLGLDDVASRSGNHEMRRDLKPGDTIYLDPLTGEVLVDDELPRDWPLRRIDAPAREPTVDETLDRYDGILRELSADDHPLLDGKRLAAERDSADAILADLIAVIRSTFGVTIEPAAESRGVHTARRRWKVTCMKCLTVLHPATTGPFQQHAAHRCS
jgi:hypothetical protein